MSESVGGLDESLLKTCVVLGSSPENSGGKNITIYGHNCLPTRKIRQCLAIAILHELHSLPC